MWSIYLASAHILYDTGLVQKKDKINFIADAGELEIKLEDNNIVMSFPRYSLVKTDTPVGFKDVIGFDPIECYKSDYDWLIAIAKSQDEILQSKPKFELRFYDDDIAYIYKRMFMPPQDFMHFMDSAFTVISENKVSFIEVGLPKTAFEPVPLTVHVPLLNKMLVAF